MENGTWQIRNTVDKQILSIAKAINDLRAENVSISDIRLMRAGQDSLKQSSLL